MITSYKKKNIYYVIISRFRETEIIIYEKLTLLALSSTKFLENKALDKIK